MNPTRILFGALALALLLAPAFSPNGQAADERERLVFFNVVFDKSLKELSANDDAFSKAVGSALSKNKKIQLLPQSTRDTLLRQRQFNLADCDKEECRFAMARALPGIKLMLEATVSKFGKACRVNMRVQRIKTGSVETDHILDVPCKHAQIDRALRGMAEVIWPPGQKLADSKYLEPLLKSSQTQKLNIGGVELGLASVPELEAVDVSIDAPVKAQQAFSLNADADVLVAYDKALSADEKGNQAPGAAAKAWNELAAMKKGNPYQKQAVERAIEWRTFAEQKLVQEAYARALEADKRGKADPKVAAEAWATLAAFKSNNRHQARASSRAAEWRAFAEQKKTDTERLAKILPLRFMKVDQKRKLLTAYEDAYGGIDRALAEKMPDELRGEFEVASSVGGGMVKVPAGKFLMGCNSSVDSNCDDDEKPSRQVYLDEFWIDKTEVTTDAYKRCVDAGRCSALGTGSSHCNWGKSDKGDHPVNCVDWNQSKSYCAWKGSRLPTEAEWEKAARGTDGRKYPWGNSPSASCRYAVMEDGGSGCGRGGTWPVGSKASGASPYGALDMAGNVYEWVSDWKASYQAGNVRNPKGPSSGRYRVLRGGPWHYDGVGDLRASYRGGSDPTRGLFYVGFRCARRAVD